MSDDTKTQQQDDKLVTAKTATPAIDQTDRAEPKPGKRSDLDDFLKASGYREGDVLSYNKLSRAFVTTNGGKYQMNSKGKVRTISGPITPRERKAAEEE